MKTLKVTVLNLVCVLFLAVLPQVAHGAAGDIVTFAGGKSVNSAARNLSLLNPAGIAVDGAGNVYIADSGNNRIWKVAAGTGAITTVAGNGTGSFSGDGGPAKAAALDTPSGIAVDGSGNLYVADQGNNRIRKISAKSRIISTVAGNGTGGYSGDNGAATEAMLDTPTDVALDSSGNLYIADQGNNRIRKIWAGTGVITTVAGNGTAGYAGDNGAAASARLNEPASVAVDSAGNIYIADELNHRVRMVAAGTGIIATVAGNGTAGYSGDNTPAAAATLYRPTGVVLDGAGNLYVADQYNMRIRKVTAATGMISTVAGDGELDYTGDDGPAAAASLAFPSDVAVDSAGRIFVADKGNNCIRTVFEEPDPDAAIDVAANLPAPKALATTTTLAAEPLLVAAAAIPAGSYIYDSFTASSTVTLESHYGETGSTWVRRGGSGAAYIDPTTGGAFDRSDMTYANTGSIPTANYSVYATIRAFNTVGSCNVGVNGRLSSGAPARYFAIFTQGVGWALYYADGYGNETRIGSVYGSRSLTPGRDYRLELRMNGSTISMYVDGVLTASGTNTRLSAAGRAGFELAGAGPGVDFEILDFRVGSSGSTATSYTLTYSAGTGGTISGTRTQTVTSGGSGTQVTAVANTGYHFVSWSDGVTTASRTDTNVTQNISATANFSANSSTYTLTYTAGAGGTISGSRTQTVAYGGSGTQVTAVPNSGYYFVSWSDGLTTASRIDSNVTRSISVTANFAASSSTGATYVSDSFTASTTVTLESHTPEIGSTWKRVGGSGYAYIDPNYDAMYSRTDVTYANNATIPTANYSVIATIRAFSSIGGNMGVTGRIGSSVPSRYFAIFTQGLGWGLYSADGFGHENRIGSLYGQTSLTPGRTYTVELRMIGSTISMYVDGVLAASGTNTLTSIAGRAGFESAGAGAGVGWEMLDFRVVGR